MTMIDLTPNELSDLIRIVEEKLIGISMHLLAESFDQNGRPKQELQTISETVMERNSLLVIHQKLNAELAYKMYPRKRKDPPSSFDVL